MKLEINKTVTETIEITFPHYTKSNISVFRFNSKYSLTKVDFTESDLGVLQTTVFPDCWMLEDPCTEAEFNRVYSEVAKKLIFPDGEPNLYTTAFDFVNLITEIEIPVSIYEELENFQTELDKWK